LRTFAPSKRLCSSGVTTGSPWICRRETITIEGDGRVIRFEIDPLRKDSLVRGLDPVGSTLEYAGDIRRFELAFHAANPWARVSGGFPQL
jgi:hypothetical protein